MRTLTFNGKTQSVSAWAKEIGIPVQTVCSRIDAGWTTEKILTAPRMVCFGANKGSFLTKNDVELLLNDMPENERPIQLAKLKIGPVTKRFGSFIRNEHRAAFDAFYASNYNKK